MGDPKRKFVGGSADELSLVDAGANLQVGVAKSADTAGQFITVVSKQKDPEPRELIVQVDGAKVAKAKRVTPAREKRLRELATEFNQIVDDLTTEPQSEETGDAPDSDVAKSKDPPAEITEITNLEVAKALEEQISAAINKALEPLNIEKQFADGAARIIELVADLEKKLEERDAKIAELEKLAKERSADLAKSRETDEQRIADIAKNVEQLMNAAPAPKQTVEELEKKEEGSVFTGLFKSVLPPSMNSAPRKK